MSYARITAMAPAAITSLVAHLSATHRKSFRRRVGARSARRLSLLGAIALVAVGSSAGTSLTFTPVPGEQLTYQREETVTSSDGTHKHNLSYAIRFTSPTSGTIIKTSAKSDPDVRGLGTFGITINNGAWTLSDGSEQYDFGLDPRLYCLPPEVVTVGTSWNCAVGGIPHWIPPGRASLRVVYVDRHKVDIEVTGVSNPVSSMHTDSDNGQQYESVETMQWRQHLTLDAGVLQEGTQDSVTVVNVANLNLVTRTHEVIRLISRSQ